MNVAMEEGGHVRLGRIGSAMNLSCGSEPIQRSETTQEENGEMFAEIKSKEYFPADLLLLSSSNDEGLCYIETSNLDGEANLKRRSALEQTWKYSPDEAQNFRGVTCCSNTRDLCEVPI
ncbi:hypothetical protein KI387_032332, partial [Taxus chinensis]